MTRMSGKSWADPATVSPSSKKTVPEGVFISCEACNATLFRKAVENNLWVCPQCEHHFRISAQQRVGQMVDVGSFEPLNANLRSTDPLSFTDLKRYSDRIEAEMRRTGQNEAVETGQAFIKGRKLILACLDLKFMMGSMGSVVGEKLARAIDIAGERNLPLVIVSCSGGARMQESGLSLMQMAKTSAALALFDDMGGLFISVLTDPTTGGVTASFAMLGDLIFAEPKALIGFAGPRVIQQTIRQELPPGFQRSEFLLEGGFVDRIVHRARLRDEIARAIDYAGK
ncbi:MAG: acetyl-CoA carboxylase, carboxyltransferase subunit beta [Phycisphaerales bacterium]